MPQETKITQYKCDCCSNTFDSYAEATECELKHKENFYEAKKLKHLPESHPKDDRYTKHCVDCGICVCEYAREWDGHRNNKGNLIFVIDNKRVFNGLRCLNCYDKLEVTIVCLLESVHEQLSKS